jgi:septum formation protein
MTSPKGALPIVSNNPRLVLASESPRRLALLKQAGIVPDAVRAPGIDERVRKREVPREHALRLAIEKAKAVTAQEPDALVLAADTVVACGRRILPKAESTEEVRACLKLLSGRRHMVTTAVALTAPGAKIRTRIVSTRLSLRRLTEAEIEAYVACGEGIGKAGGYAIQGRAEIFVRSLNGSYSNVVGLPLAETVSLLGGCGYSAPC